MGLFDKLSSAMQKVSDFADKMGKDEEAEATPTYNPPKYDAFRPLVRTVLMKEEVSDRDLDVLRHKAIALGMDADEFEMQFEALASMKQATIKKNMFGKKVDTGSFFMDDDLGEGSMFDREFDKLFLSSEEQHAKQRRKAQEDEEDLKGLSGLTNLIEYFG